MDGPVPVDGGMLHLVRHGESTWNVAGLLQGCTPHVPLTTRGAAQARAAADALADRPVAAVVSSDQRRAADTAAVVAARLGLPVVTTPALREQCHGAWEGRPAVGRAAALACAGPGWAPAGGESGEALARRVATFLAGLGAGETVVVSHGETLRTALVLLTGAAAGVPANGSVTSLVAGPGGRWQVVGPVSAGRFA
ncbi:histidine phosphatase family protein [Pseudonocardia sp. N23]|uniref:histidine phosphatase family protein n=1 Tax=Pseudonocardia sp. N23 TaxID=1987376 RepID=UPI000BFE219F|nr:histidine phosphatase family protein [Pseudonocardia sp. N23]GAY11243.1 phosphoglycerate mutase family [Pseudonocardia sp. N23]